MAAPMEKTRHAGIYKRGSRYAVIFRDADGRQRQATARTLDEARKLKAARTADVARGEFHTASREKFRDYAEAWVCAIPARVARASASRRATTTADCSLSSLTPTSATAGSPR